jgi:hypothetical protein
VLPRGRGLCLVLGRDLVFELASSGGGLAESGELITQLVAVVGGVGHREKSIYGVEVNAEYVDTEDANDAKSGSRVAAGG